MENQEQNEIEFDLMQMLRYLLKRVWIILLAMVVFAVGSYIISKKNTVPQYTASCRVFVYREGSDANYNDQVSSLYLVKNSEVILTGRNVAAQVIEDLGLNLSATSVSNKIKVSVEDDTHVLELKYTDTNPKRAAAILNEVCIVGGAEVERLIPTADFTVIYEAEVPTSPGEDTILRDTVLGAAVGVVLVVAVLIVLFLLDDTIRNEDDVERYLGLSTLTAVTLSPDLASDSKTAELARKKVPAIREKKK